MTIPVVRDRPLTPPVSPPVARPAPTPEGPGEGSASPSPFARLLHGIGHEVQHGEALVRGAISSAAGADLSPGALIALQAGVYRYSEAVDLASRLVDHATTALKTVVQGQ
jgi:hypothetical protein